MAITKQIINLDFDAFKSYLDTMVPEYFNSVIKTSTVITCKDSDENTILTIAQTNLSEWVWTAFANAENNIVSGSNAPMRVYAAFKCTNGILFQLGNMDSTGFQHKNSVIISKTNKGKTGIIFSDYASNNSTIAHTEYVNICVWGDVVPLQKRVDFGAGLSDSHQTVMFPFTTHCSFEDISYFPNAFFIPVRQYNYTGKITIDGKIYLTNGYWAIKDE